MIRFLLLFCIAVICLVAFTSSASAGEFMLSGDVGGLSCNIADDSPGLVNVHIFVYDVIDFTAAQFAAPVPECWTGATWISDNVAEGYLSIGDSQDAAGGGLSIAATDVVGCQDAPVYLGYIVINTTGEAVNCCAYPIVKAQGDLHPEFDGPIMVRCQEDMDDLYDEAATVGGVVNSDGNCAFCPTSPVPVEETSWGRVKALYN